MTRLANIEHDFAELKATAITNIEGDGVYQRGNSVTIDPGEDGGEGLNPFPAFVTATSLGGNRWSYAFVELVLLSDGIYATKPNPRMGTAYNRAEAMNSSTGMQGNGVNASTYAGVSIGPCVNVQTIGTETGCNGIAYWFDKPNPVLPTCS